MSRLENSIKQLPEQNLKMSFFVTVGFLGENMKINTATIWCARVQHHQWTEFSRFMYSCCCVTVQLAKLPVKEV
jgi:hypothetical protein